MTAILALAACGDTARGGGQTGSSATAPQGAASGAFVKPSNEELKKRLTALQYHVTQEAGTEFAFRNEFWDNKQPGIYVDIVSGEPLFSSLDKFDSGTGWPSFTRPLDPGAVTANAPRTLSVFGTEVRSKRADSHLGHVFDDGPKPTGVRFCINSAALRFVPVEKLAEAGYAEYLPLFGKTAAGADAATSGTGTTTPGDGKAHATGAAPSGTGTAPSATGEPRTTGDSGKRETAVLAGGCFWGMQEILRDIPGVIHTDVGYTGGTTSHPNYEQVSTETSGHAESVRIIFDPDRLSYEALLGYFFRMHDPTTLNRQGNDMGTSYRSAIFYADDAQRRTAEAVKARVNASGKWPRPVVTEIAPATEFWPAEDYHQDYLEKHPGGYTCHYLRD